jgi:molecular chaperone GrpE
MSESLDPEQASETSISSESAVADQAAHDSGPLAELQKEKDVLHDRLLRTAAEFDNYRRRIERERRDQADNAVAGALEELLPIIDNLDLALGAPAGSDPDVYRKGVELIQLQMAELVRKRGVKPIAAVGADFDPRFHQAVVHEESAEHREGEVMEELRRGYMLGDRLLRAALVKVAKA